MVNCSVLTLKCARAADPEVTSLDRLDGKHVVFGQVKEGIDVVTKMESFGLHDGGVIKKIVIADCGEMK